MIRVEEQVEPVTFAGNVRQPGDLFLAATPNPTSKAWKQHDYWRRAALDLYRAYDGVCAYTCHRIELDTGWPTVEHFVPKTADPRLAYDWRNFRLVCGRMNGRKGKHRDVLDPFRLDNGVFFIDFPSLQVHPATGLPGPVEAQAWSTIHRLQLNDDTCIQGRHSRLDPYCRGVYDLDYLAEIAPFISREIVRQNLVAPRICEVMTTSAD